MLNKYAWVLKIHRLSAVVLLIFISLHLINHISAVRSVEAHRMVMEAFRVIYRTPLIEPVLIFLVVVQSVTGGMQLRNTWRKWPHIWHKVQFFSGAYLLFFLTNHTIAVLFTLRILLELDSDFYAAAGGLHVEPLQWFFIPYYLLAVIAFFAHIASYVYFKVRLVRDSRSQVSSVILTGGVILSVFIVGAFSGLFYEVELPDNVRKSYEQMIGKG